MLQIYHNINCYNIYKFICAFVNEIRIGLLEKNNASEDSLLDWEIEEARKREEYKTLYGEAPAPAGDYDDPFNPAPAESFEPQEAGGERGDDSRRSGPFRQLGRCVLEVLV
jgi:hypothetical protein